MPVVLQSVNGEPLQTQTGVDISGFPVDMSKHEGFQRYLQSDDKVYEVKVPALWAKKDELRQTLKDNFIKIMYDDSNEESFIVTVNDSNRKKAAHAAEARAKQLEYERKRDAAEPIIIMPISENQPLKTEDD